MKNKIKQILPISMIELLILSIILTYYFSTSPGLFPFSIPLDFIISLIMVSIMILIAGIICLILDYIIYMTTKKISKVTNVLYFIVPLVPFIQYIISRF